MLTIIGSDDIYGVANQNILSTNRLDGVTVTEDDLTISTDEVSTEELSSGVSITDSSSDFEVSIDKYSSSYGDTIVRIEAYYTTFTTTVDVSQAITLTSDNITFVSKGTLYNGSTEYYTSEDVTDETIALYDSSDLFDGETQEYEQTGLFGTDGVVSLTYDLRHTTLVASVELTQTVTVVNNGNGNYTLTVRYPFKISMVEADANRIRTILTPHEFYKTDSIAVYLYAKASIDAGSSSSTVQVGSFDVNGNVFSVSDNSLILKNTEYDGQRVSEYNASKILSAWGSGRESVDIDVMIGEFYDEVGTLSVSTEDESLPMTFNIGDIVVPLTIDESGNETGVSNILVNTFSPVAYKVYGIQAYYDGACWQKLNLISVTQTEVCYILLDVEDGVDVTITRVSAASETDSIGVLKVPIANTGDVVTIEFSYSGDKEYSNIQCTVNGSEYTSGDEYTISGTTEVYIRATTFEVLTWEQIDSICSEGLEGEYFSVGDSKTIFIDEGLGTSSSFNQYHDVVILGINHDTLIDGGTATLTIGMTDCLIDSSDSYYWAEEEGISWENSLLRNDFIPNTILPQFPEDLQTVIKTVVKGSFGSYLKETLFPLAVTEVMGANEQTLNEVVESLGLGTYGDLINDGDIYEYWESVKKGSVANNRKKLRQYPAEIIEGTYKRAYSPYFTRSYVESTNFNKYFVGFNRSGQIEGYSALNLGVSLAFCVGAKPYSKTLEDASWEEISSISETGNASEYFSIGDVKTVELTDGQTIQVRIVGFNQDTLSDGTSLAGITFESVNVLSSEYVYNNSENYDTPLLSDDLYTTTLVSIFNNLIPSDLSSVIKTVRKVSSAQDEENLSYTTVNLFLPYLMNIGLDEYASEYEIMTGNFVYSFYEDATHTTAEALTKTLYGDDSPCAYWTSSYDEGFSASGYGVFPVAINENGEAEKKKFTDTAHVAFWFCV